MTTKQIETWMKRENEIRAQVEALADADRNEDDAAVEQAVQALTQLRCCVDFSAAGWIVTR